MSSLLESSLRRQIAKGFKGRLLTGTLRRAAVASLDAYGDPTLTFTDYTFNGIRESFDARWAAQAGIPITDVGVLIIGGSIAVEPLKGDKVKIRDQWYEVRAVLDIDPANASYRLQCFLITDQGY